MTQYLHFIFSILLVFFAISIFLTKNPIFSVLFLILCFIFSAVTLLLFDIDFLALLFIMVYVGAVAVLFLFVVMMVDTKSITKKLIGKGISFPIFFFIIFLGLFFFFSIFNFINDSFFNIDNDLISNSPAFNTSTFITLSGIELLGQALFNYYNINVLLAGFVLLIALVGPICLTLDFKETKNLGGQKASSRNLTLIRYFS